MKVHCQWNTLDLLFCDYPKTLWVSIAVIEHLFTKKTHTYGVNPSPSSASHLIWSCMGWIPSAWITAKLLGSYVQSSSASVFYCVWRCKRESSPCRHRPGFSGGHRASVTVYRTLKASNTQTWSLQLNLWLEFATEAWELPRLWHLFSHIGAAEGPDVSLLVGVWWDISASAGVVDLLLLRVALPSNNSFCPLILIIWFYGM